jgi:cytidylate kinase
MSAPAGDSVITMDGPAASGKSSVARLVARRLGWLFVGTGSMYRAVTWALLETGVNPADPRAVASAVRALRIEFPVEDGEAQIAVNGRILHEELTSDAVNKAVSLVASVPEVRARRRHAQGHADNLSERDKLDSTRKTSPLVIAPDAVVIDSSDLTLDGVVCRVLEILAARGLAIPAS